ncbi:hypothetical protein, partial [Geodermatophilus obscurus]|uniref:hypothetical protein n=1 Tax=Geodermatophilus obscurus TaxID=1861 RepID=UPI001AD92E6A
LVVRFPNSRYSRLLLARWLLYIPAYKDRREKEEGAASLDLNPLFIGGEEADRRDLEAVCKLLAPMVARHPFTGRWQWHSPDVDTALLRARAGELLGDEDAVVIDELKALAAKRLTYTTPTIGEPLGYYLRRPYLMPQGWEGELPGRGARYLLEELSREGWRLQQG